MERDDTFASQPAPRKRRGLTLLVAIVVVVVVVIAVGAVLFATRDTSTNPTNSPVATVVNFRGTGDKTTTSFKVAKGWAIQWRSEAKRFSFAIKGDRDFGTVVSRKKPGSGVTTPVESGTFTLEITANGPWSIRIVQPPS